MDVVLNTISEGKTEAELELGVPGGADTVTRR